MAREIEKATSIHVTRCGCGRIAIVLLDENDEVFAGAELDDDQWVTFCSRIIAVTEGRTLVLPADLFH